MDSDELKQKEIIKLRELKREVKETADDLERLREAREEIGKELKDLTHYQGKSKKEYQSETSKHLKLGKKIELSQGELRKLEGGKKTLLEQLDGKLLEKTKELNHFKNSKRDFVNKLKNQEKELQQKDKELEQRITESSNKDIELIKREESLKKGLDSVQGREEGIDVSKALLKLTEHRIRHDRGIVDEMLDRTERIKQEKEQELEKQLNLTKTLENKIKILDLRTEAQNKREAPVKRREEELDKREIKLADDRQALQRAIVEKLMGQ